MTESCAPNPALARKSHTALLRALASVGQKPAGEAIGKSETWVSRWKSDDSETFAQLLAVVGLKVVPAEYKCYAADYIDHLRYFARIGFAIDEQRDGKREEGSTLIWGEEEES